MSLNVSSQIVPNKQTIEIDILSLKNQFNYCVAERDKAEQIVTMCKADLKLGEERVTLRDNEVKKCEQIIEVQKTTLTNNNDQIKELKEEKSQNRLIFGILGFVIGIVLHIPIIKF